MNPHVVVGQSVAALAAVERLAANGEHVRWLVTGSVGGSFAPKTVDGRHLGLGLRVIEHDDGVGDYVSELLPDLRELPTPLITLGERVVEDFTLTGGLAAVTELLDDRTLDRITADLLQIRETSSPAGVLDEPGPIGLTLRQASICNHGELFHRIVVDSIASALVPGGAGAVEATQRHRIGAPLYGPEMLLQAITGGATACEPRRFLTDRHGGSSDVVTVLERRIGQSPNVERLDVGTITALANVGAHTELAFDSGHVEHALAPMLATPPSESFAAARIPHHADRVATSFLWLDVDERDVLNPSPTTFLDDDLVFRVCATTPEADRVGGMRRAFSVELRTGAPPDARQAIRSLARAGLITERARPSVLAHHRIPAFVVPSAANRHAFEQASSDLSDALPATRFLGGLATYGADGLTEQLIGGLAAAEEVCGAHV